MNNQFYLYNVVSDREPLVYTGKSYPNLKLAKDIAVIGMENADAAREAVLIVDSEGAPCYRVNRNSMIEYGKDGTREIKTDE